MATLNDASSLLNLELFGKRVQRTSGYFVSSQRHRAFVWVVVALWICALCALSYRRPLGSAPWVLMGVFAGVRIVGGGGKGRSAAGDGRCHPIEGAVSFFESNLNKSLKECHLRVKMGQLRPYITAVSYRSAR